MFYVVKNLLTHLYLTWCECQPVWVQNKHEALGCSREWATKDINILIQEYGINSNNLTIEPVFNNNF